MGSILASATLAGIMDVTPNAFFGTVPAESNGQSLLVEIIISFLLMFVISGVTTDNRAVRFLYHELVLRPLFLSHLIVHGLAPFVR